MYPFGGRWGCENKGGAGIKLQHEYVSSLAWWCGGSLCCRGGGVGDGTSPTFISQTLRDGTPQVHIQYMLNENRHMPEIHT